MNQKQLTMTSCEFKEYSEGKEAWHIGKTSIDTFNLILGDNAQGKTRFFNKLKFLKNVHSGIPTANAFSPDLGIKAGITFKEQGLEAISIIYKLHMVMTQGQPMPEFSEEVIRQERILFSRANRQLVNEMTGYHVENLFLPPHIPALLSITGSEFPTIANLKSFFERILFLEANRFTSGNVESSKGAWFLNSIGSNIGSVLDTWRQKQPNLFNEIVAEFEDCFNFVRKDSLTTKEYKFPIGVDIPLAAFMEEGSETEIYQIEWSDGMLRALSLFALIATRFQQNEENFLRPSLVFVDEMENGLDFKTLQKVLGFYQNYSNLVQIFISSHSPTVCNLINPKYWHVAKRKGTTVQLLAPKDKEPDLDEQRKRLLQDNWEFYKNHIAQSKLYGAE